MADILEMRGEGLDTTYYLEGMPIREGQPLQLQLYVGQWIAGAFEWDGRPHNRPRLRVRSPLPLSAALSTFHIGAHSLVRWPLGEAIHETEKEAAVDNRRFSGAADAAPPASAEG